MNKQTSKQTNKSPPQFPPRRLLRSQPQSAYSQLFSWLFTAIGVRMDMEGSLWGLTLRDTNTTIYGFSFLFLLSFPIFRAVAFRLVSRGKCRRRGATYDDDDDFMDHASPGPQWTCALTPCTMHQGPMSCAMPLCRYGKHVHCSHLATTQMESNKSKDIYGLLLSSRASL